MNHKLIHDEAEFNKFINLLPDLKENEGYFLILIGRAKWRPETGMKAAAKLVRETANRKDGIYHMIKRWEVEEGVYKDNLADSNSTIIHQNNLGVYIGYNPKDHRKAAGNLLKKCTDAIISNKAGINVKSMANDAIQIANGTRHFIDIDCDMVEGEDWKDVLKFIHDIVGKDNTIVVKTSGGFHCLIKLKNMKGNNMWHQAISKHTFKSTLNLMSSDLMPVPGCNQGKAVPYIVE